MSQLGTSSAQSSDTVTHLEGDSQDLFVAGPESQSTMLSPISWDEKAVFYLIEIQECNNFTEYPVLK